MTLETITSPDGAATGALPQSAADNLDRLWAELPRLTELGPPNELLARFTDHVAALRFLLHAASDRPLVVGLVGGASCGKSTLFNSLVRRRISRVHYQPHSSVGPIAFVHRRHRVCLAPEAAPRRFLPALESRDIADERGDDSTGAVDAVTIALHDDDRWRNVAILDLPDISSESARREGWLVRRLLPWMDLVVWMLDPNDYLFEDLYIDLIEQSAALGQRSLVVVNDIHGQVSTKSELLEDRIARFRTDASFVLPRLECSPREPYPLFRAEPAFARLRDTIAGFHAARPIAPLAAQVRHDAAAIAHANAEWARRVRELTTALERQVARHRKRMLAAAPILSVLPAPAQEELERLRNRFSVWHQSKRLYQAIRNPARTLGRAAVRNFQMSASDLDTEPLYRHLVGALKEFGVELHRTYLESRLVAEMQQADAAFEPLGSFNPESLDFRSQLDAVAQQVFRGGTELLSDQSILRDPKLQFAGGATGVVLAFFLVESMIGLPGVTTIVGSTVTALVGILSPELANLLPMDRVGKLVRGARDTLAATLDAQMRRIVEFYTSSRGRYLEPGDPLTALLAVAQTDAASLASADDRHATGRKESSR